MIELSYKNFYKNGNTFVYAVKKKEVKCALRKIARNYFQINKEDTVVHVTKARWIIDWFLDEPLEEECSLMEWLVEEFEEELHDCFEDEAKDAFDEAEEYDFDDYHPKPPWQTNWQV